MIKYCDIVVQYSSYWNMATSFFSLFFFLDNVDDIFFSYIFLSKHKNFKSVSRV